MEIMRASPGPHCLLVLHLKGSGYLKPQRLKDLMMSMTSLETVPMRNMTHLKNFTMMSKISSQKNFLETIYSPVYQMPRQTPTLPPHPLQNDGEVSYPHPLWAAIFPFELC